MSVGLVLEILAGIAVVVWGIYLGRPGRDTRSKEEIEEALTRPGRRRRVKRSFTPLDFLSTRRRSPRRGGRSRFHTAIPDREPAGEGPGEGEAAVGDDVPSTGDQDIQRSEPRSDDRSK